MSPQRKRLLYGLALAATLVLIWFAPKDDDAVSSADTAKRGPRGKTAPVAVASKQSSSPAAPSAAGEIGLLAQAGRSAPVKEVADLFRARSWYVPPPPPPPPPPSPPAPPPPAPPPPPLPFVFMGQYIEGDTRLIILTRGDRVMTVSVGQTIDNTYRVKSLGGGVLTFVYLPRDVEQTLSTGVTQ